MLRLSCAAQKYDWGKPASTSAVAALLRAGGGAVDAGAPYAELWAGSTHPSGPSRVRVAACAAGPEADVDLQAWLCGAGAAALGAAAPAAGARAPASALPFLLKVLSIARALSVQAHPDAARAQVLHATKPDLYKVRRRPRYIVRQCGAQQRRRAPTALISPRPRAGRQPQARARLRADAV
jgi:mannose-6-phosphate isomerase